MAANKERGEIDIVAKGQTYTLKLTVNALCELETLAKRSVEDVYQGAQAGRVTDIRLLIWAALQEKHPTTTLKDAGKLIDAAGGLDGLLTQLEALMALNTSEAAPEGGAGEAANPPDAEDGTGGNSTPTPVASA